MMKTLFKHSQQTLERQVTLGLVAVGVIGLGLIGIQKYQHEQEVQKAKIWLEWIEKTEGKVVQKKAHEGALKQLAQELERAYETHKGVSKEIESRGEFMAAFKLEEEWFKTKGQTTLNINQARLEWNHVWGVWNGLDGGWLSQWKSCAQAIETKEWRESAESVIERTCPGGEQERIKLVWKGWGDESVKVRWPEMRGYRGANGVSVQKWIKDMQEAGEYTQSTHPLSKQMKQLAIRVQEEQQKQKELQAYQEEVDQRLQERKDRPEVFRAALSETQKDLLRTQRQEKDKALTALEELEREGEKHWMDKEWEEEDWTAYRAEIKERKEQVIAMNEWAEKQIKSDYQQLSSGTAWETPDGKGEWSGSVGTNETAAQVSAAASTPQAVASGGSSSHYSHPVWIHSGGYYRTADYLAYTWMNHSLSQGLVTSSVRPTSTVNTGSASASGSTLNTGGISNGVSNLKGVNGAVGQSFAQPQMAPVQSAWINNSRSVKEAYNIENPKSHMNEQLSRVQAFKSLRNSIMAKNNGQLAIKSSAIQNNVRAIQSQRVARTSISKGSSSRVSSARPAGMGGRGGFGG